jgi:hypothetical protein
MKKMPLIFAALIFAASAGAQPQQDLIAQIHFAGAKKISADTNHVAFTNEFCSAEAKALREQAAGRLAAFLDGWLRKTVKSAVPDGAAKLRPLLDDLQTAEWFLEAHTAADGRPQIALAAKLDDTRAQAWRQALQPFFAAAPDKWEVNSGGGLFCFNYGTDSKTIRDDLVRKIPQWDNAWFSADLNWPRLAQIFPALREFDFPKIQMQVVGRGGNLQFNGKLALARPLPPLEKWRIPTNTIHQPLVSFTAARGTGPWLVKQPWMRPFEIQPQPDQLFVWALARMPFQTFAAEPVPDAKAALAQLDQRLSADTSWRKQFIGPVTLMMTNNEISWRGMPLMTPNVRAVREPAGDFLVGGLFPNMSKPVPLPPELLAHLNQPNLVYYHWEATAERLKVLPLQLSQLLLVFTRHEQIKTQSAAAKWLDRIGPALGSTITEVTQTAPNELAFKRAAPGGLTAIELLALVDWLEAPQFPAFDLRLQPPRVRPEQKPLKVLSSPAAPAPLHP